MKVKTSRARRKMVDVMTLKGLAFDAWFSGFHCLLVTVPDTC